MTKREIIKLIDCEEFDNVAEEIYIVWELVYRQFQYNDKDKCFYSMAWQTLKKKQYKSKMTFEEANGEIIFKIYLGNFKDETMSEWTNEVQIGTIAYKDGQWYN